jgi:hypothetical protein
MNVDYQSIKIALREVLAEEMGFGRYAIAPRWDGGTLVLKPADDSLKSKEIPLEGFFKKITAVREKLRVLEQKINNNKDVSAEDRLEMQKLISRAQGSLTTFNILFAEDEDKFEGTHSD